MSSDSPLAIYLDPVNGQDCNLGLSKDCAVKTALGLASSIQTMEDPPEIIMYLSPDLGRWVKL